MESDPAQGDPSVPSKRTNPAIGISANLNGCLDENMAQLRQQVVDRAYELSFDRRSASADGEGPSSPGTLPGPQMEDVSQAFREATERASPREQKATFFDLFPPFTCLCFLLCLVFGGLGLYALNGVKDPKLASATSGFLDIAKIFAGALVGSTTSNVLAITKSKRGAR